MPSRRLPLELAGRRCRVPSRTSGRTAILVLQQAARLNVCWTVRTNPENLLTRDEMLDDSMLYWLPNAAAASARLYWESYNKFNYEPVQIPVGCSIFPKEIVRASRRWAEKRYQNLVYWNRLDRGGRFAAFEQADLFVRELRACFGKMRAM